MIKKDYFTVRLGTADDVFQVAEVFADSVRELCKNDYEPDTIARWINSKPAEARLEYVENNSLWIAEVNGNIAGYLVSIPGEVIALFVSSSYAGSGIGTSLLKLGIEIAAKDGLYDVKLQSTITAAPFYEKIGFGEVGRGYYTHDQSGLKLPIINMVLL